MIRIQLRGDREVVARLTAFPDALRAVLRRKVRALTLKLQARVMMKLSGQVLKVQTGALRRSIQSDVSDTAEGVRGRVFSTGDVKYAAIHEFGGKTRAHIIMPRKGKFLKFMGSGGSDVYARKVNHPGSVMPERSFMRSSLADMRDEIIAELSSAVAEAGGDT